MSLLMDALTRAEKAKKQAEAGGKPAEDVEVAAQETLAAGSADSQERAPGPLSLEIGEETAAAAEPGPEAFSCEREEENALVLDLAPETDLSIEVTESVPDAAVTETAEPVVGYSARKPAPEVESSPVASPVHGTAAAAGHSPFKARTVFLAKKQGKGLRDLRSRLLPVAVGISVFITFVALSYLGYRIFSDKPSSILVNPETLQTLSPPADVPEQAVETPKVAQPESPSLLAEAEISPAESAAPPEKTPVPGAEKTAPAPPEPDAAVAVKPPGQAPDSGDKAQAIVITRRKAPPAIDPSLAEAYAAYRHGDIERAGQAYLKVLQADPLHRTALLGLAAIAIQRGEFEVAFNYYRRLLERDPGDPMARAGMLSVVPATDFSRQASELKLLLAKHPETAALHFALGNLYAAQKNWPEAQQAYSAAFALERKSAGGAGVLAPDYAFNLAVSLEHLGRSREAISYYKEALALAGPQLPVAFERGLALERIAMLNLLQEPAAP